MDEKQETAEEKKVDRRVDRRVRKTKKQLRQALTVLLQEKPIKDITVREIADMVDINRGTFYLHYKDVYDMLEQIENEIFDEFNGLINAHPPARQQGKPLPLLKDVFTYFQANADMAMALMGPNGDHAFIDKLKNLVKEWCFHDWMQVFNSKQSTNFEYFYSFIVYGCIGLFQTWLEAGMMESPEEMAALAEQMILNGVKVLE